MERNANINNYSGIISPKIEKYSIKCLENCRIEPQLHLEHQVFRGLRDLKGKGVLTGLTEISDIISKKVIIV